MDFDNKASVKIRAYDVLADGVTKRDSLFHTPTFSNQLGGIIDSRVMVLREFCDKERLLRFHSDYRSNKIRELIKDPSSAVLGYDPNLKIQIRLAGETTVHHQDNITKAAWEESQHISKKCYSVKDGSSKKVKNPSDYDFELKGLDVEEGYANFAVLKFNYCSMEFLYLQRSGHRRCKFEWSKNGVEKSFWLVP